MPLARALCAATSWARALGKDPTITPNLDAVDLKSRAVSRPLASMSIGRVLRVFGLAHDQLKLDVSRAGAIASGLPCGRGADSVPAAAGFLRWASASLLALRAGLRRVKLTPDLLIPCSNVAVLERDLPVLEIDACAPQS